MVPSTIPFALRLSKGYAPQRRALSPPPNPVPQPPPCPAPLSTRLPEGPPAAGGLSKDAVAQHYMTHATHRQRCLHSPVGSRRPPQFLGRKAASASAISCGFSTCSKCAARGRTNGLAFGNHSSTRS